VSGGAGRETDGSDGRSVGAAGEDGTPPEPRPLIERIGLAAVAAVLALLFAFVAVVSWFGGEIFLAFMGALGAGVTVWLAVRTLLRG
jgi:hypothetical protein